MTISLPQRRWVCAMCTMTRWLRNNNVVRSWIVEWQSAVHRSFCTKFILMSLASGLWVWRTLSFSVLTWIVFDAIQCKECDILLSLLSLIIFLLPFFGIFHFITSNVRNRKRKHTMSVHATTTSTTRCLTFFVSRQRRSRDSEWIQINLFPIVIDCAQLIIGRIDSGYYINCNWHVLLLDVRDARTRAHHRRLPIQIAVASECCRRCPLHAIVK